jgi:hypothetical protein
MRHPIIRTEIVSGLAAWVPHLIFTVGALVARLAGHAFAGGTGAAAEYE